MHDGVLRRVESNAFEHTAILAVEHPSGGTERTIEQLNQLDEKFWKDFSHRTSP